MKTTLLIVDSSFIIPVGYLYALGIVGAFFIFWKVTRRKNGHGKNENKNNPAKKQAEEEQKKAVAQTFKDIDDHVDRLEQIPLDDHNFDELGKFEKRVDELMERIGALAQFQCINFTSDQVWLWQDLMERFDIIYKKVNNREKVLNNTSYVNSKKQLAGI
jgi:predicted nuclease with TOPRIM domain